MFSCIAQRKVSISVTRGSAITFITFVKTSSNFLVRTSSTFLIRASSIFVAKTRASESSSLDWRISADRKYTSLRCINRTTIRTDFTIVFRYVTTSHGFVFKQRNKHEVVGTLHGEAGQICCVRGNLLCGLDWVVFWPNNRFLAGLGTTCGGVWSGFDFRPQTAGIRDILLQKIDYPHDSGRRIFAYPSTCPLKNHSKILSFLSM